MKALVFDTSALLALLFGEPGAETVEALMHRASEKDQPMLMSAVNWAEVCYRVEGKRGTEALVPCPPEPLVLKFHHHFLPCAPQRLVACFLLQVIPLWRNPAH